MRAMVSQMANHKTKARVVPSPWRKQFSCIADSIKVQVDDGTNSDDGCEVVPTIQPKPCSVVDISESDNEVADKLFERSDPQLQRLLSGYSAQVKSDIAEAPTVTTPIKKSNMYLDE